MKRYELIALLKDTHETEPTCVVDQWFRDFESLVMDDCEQEAFELACDMSTTFDGIDHPDVLLALSGHARRMQA